jgi:hypothetical protein
MVDDGISYVNGFPAGDPESVFRFRHPDERKETAMDLRAKIARKDRITFKAEALPLKLQVGGYRILCSRDCPVWIESDSRGRSNLDGHSPESIPGPPQVIL